jgi:Mn-dependent DtxR family transcriptional regulator
MTYDVADSLGVNDVDDAVKHAAAMGWIEVEREHSIRLTDKGRRPAKPR